MVEGEFLRRLRDGGRGGNWPSPLGSVARSYSHDNFGTLCADGCVARSATSGGSAAVNAKKGVTLNIVLGAATLLVSTFLPVPTGMKGVIILFAAIALAAGSGVGWYYKSTIKLQFGRASCREKVCQYV